MLYNDILPYAQSTRSRIPTKVNHEWPYKWPHRGFGAKHKPKLVKNVHFLKICPTLLYMLLLHKFPYLFDSSVGKMLIFMLLNKTFLFSPFFPDISINCGLEDSRIHKNYGSYFVLFTGKTSVLLVFENLWYLVTKSE